MAVASMRQPTKAGSCRRSDSHHPADFCGLRGASQYDWTPGAVAVMGPGTITRRLWRVTPRSAAGVVPCVSPTNPPCSRIGDTHPLTFEAKRRPIRRPLLGHDPKRLWSISWKQRTSFAAQGERK